MRNLIKMLPIGSFVDDDNNPCCAALIDGKTEHCIFLRTSYFGTIETCVVLDTQQSLHRRGENGLGTLIPPKECPIWGVYTNEK